MRMLVNIAAFLVALAAAAVFYVSRSQSTLDEELADAAQDVVRQVEQVVRVRATIAGTELNARGYPRTVDPAWFEGGPPINPLVSPRAPWIEIAPREDADLEHPAVRLAVHPDLAGLWYNPFRGVVRARVPVQVSDERSTRLYNRVNGVNVRSVLEPERDSVPTRTPESKPASDTPVADGRSG